MKDKELKNLTKFVKTVSKYKPNEIPKKPDHQPSVKELNEMHTLDLRKMKINIK